MPAGRPTDYSDELAARICEWIAGGKSLRSFTREPDTPDLSTITRWIVRHEQFRTQYVDAREAAGYAHADRIADIVESLLDPEGDLDPQRAKIAIDAEKWTAERMAPRVHMPQSLINHESPQGTMTPQPSTIHVVGVQPQHDNSDD